MVHGMFCAAYRGASLRIHWSLERSNDFAWYICQFSENVKTSLHTFKNSAFGASEFDTPIKDQKWSGRFVERIQGSDRGSSIGGASLRINRFLEKSNDFPAYIRKFCFWSFRIRHPYRGSEMEWSFRRENFNIRSGILHRGGSLRIHGFSKKSIDFAWYIR